MYDSLHYSSLYQNHSGTIPGVTKESLAVTRGSHVVALVPLSPPATAPLFASGPYQFMRSLSWPLPPSEPQGYQHDLDVLRVFWSKGGRALIVSFFCHLSPKSAMTAQNLTSSLVETILSISTLIPPTTIAPTQPRD